MDINKVTAALQHFIRRSVLEFLHKEPLSVAAIHEKLSREYGRPGQIFGSRASVSQHLKVLSDTGLVTPHREGTRHVYRLNVAALDELRGSLDRLGN
jgi:DNA-binding transcriptional ArsR family regulator